MSADYAELSRRLADLTALEEVVGILSWDQEIVMPSGAAQARGRQLSTVQVVAHERLTDPRLAALLAGLQQDATLDATQTANVREARRDVQKATCVPSGDGVRSSADGTEAKFTTAPPPNWSDGAFQVALLPDILNQAVRPFCDTTAR